ncbi:hypothetical protein SS50377_20570 [Spironucleus salmonicida]|uniref:Uncharacterized protein n=1 Tax=Spironucleus salmonicida TaxID=348837 RepID=V6LU86_9EUKA|nr:hypothetical protein SS50377_20570 [Spironucleus salmonicida]|eukprot:EST48172.1 Hypothetical protein SS50377_11690 [Spironucleus salmonicida]
MTHLTLDVNTPQTTSANLQKLLALYQQNQSAANRAIFVSAFALSAANSQFLANSLLKIMRKGLKIDFSLHEDVFRSLPNFLSKFLSKENQVLLVDLQLACLYLRPPTGDFLLEKSLPENSSQIFPSGAFYDFLDTFLTSKFISKTGLNYIIFRIKQYKDLFFFSLFYCKNLNVISQKQLIFVQNVLDSGMQKAKFFDFSAEKLAVPVGFSAEIDDFYEIEERKIVQKGVENENQNGILLDLEPAQKQTQDDKLAQLTQKRLLKNKKYKEAEFESFLVLKYDFPLLQIKKSIFNNIIQQYEQLEKTYFKELNSIISEQNGFAGVEILDTITKIYENLPSSRMVMLTLMLVLIRSSNAQIHDFYGKVYDEITVENFSVENKTHIYYILKQIFQKSTNLMTKLAILLKLNSVILHIPSDAQFYALLLSFSAFLREPKLRFLISREQENIEFSASKIVRNRSFEAVLEHLNALFAADNLESIQLLEWNLLQNSTSNHIFTYIQQVIQGNSIENDLDLDEFATLNLQKVISEQQGQRQELGREQLFAGDNIARIERRLFGSAGNASDTKAEFRSEIDFPEFVAQAARAQSGGSLMLQSVKFHAKMRVFVEICSEINGFWEWKSGEVQRFVCEKGRGEENVMGEEGENVGEMEEKWEGEEMGEQGAE